MTRCKENDKMRAKQVEEVAKLVKSRWKIWQRNANNIPKNTIKNNIKRDG